MADICGVPIPKMDVLMEDFSTIQELIEQIALDRDQLIAMRNRWEVFFLGYDDDPREIPDIPEVINWIEQSVEIGIPWFYFMRSNPASTGLLTFMICCGAEHEPQYPERHYFDQDRILPFIKKNLENLERFVEQYDIPEEIGYAATDDIMEYVQNVLKGTLDGEQTSGAMSREKQHQEALVRLSMLEELFGLNPKVKTYFEDGRLYYSYLTAGGYMGSIDTIRYDARYASAVSDFEEQTSYLVYHVIEHKHTISVLFVSDMYDRWLDERPTNAGVMAWVFDVETGDNEFGYIKLDVLQGALRRINDTVYSEMPGKGEQYPGLSDVDCEIVERLEILKKAGMMTDLDMTRVYVHEGEICCSVLQMIMGTPVGVVNRISSNAAYAKLVDLLSKQMSEKPYFLMGSTGKELALLYLSENPADWEEEKLALEKGIPCAVVINLRDMTAKYKRIEYEIVNGGPLFLCD